MGQLPENKPHSKQFQSTPKKNKEKPHSPPTKSLVNPACVHFFLCFSLFVSRLFAEGHKLWELKKK